MDEKVKKLKEQIDTDEMPSTVDNETLIDKAAWAYLAGYAAAKKEGDVKAVNNDKIKAVEPPTDTLTAPGTIEPLRISIPWWP